MRRFLIFHIAIVAVFLYSCQNKQKKWKEFITELDSLSGGTVPVLFIFHPKDKREISYLLKRDDIDIPVCIDEKDRINALNRFPENQSFQCFLIDKDNKVVYIGNPVHNPRIRALYLRQVTENRYVADSGLSRNTRIRIEQTDFDLGKLKQENAATVSVFCNTDTSPLIIRLKGTVEQ